MNQEAAFTFTYSAKENREILEIRKKYLPKTESKLEELKRLDELVQGSGMLESLCVGIISVLILGVGMCMAMQIIGSGTVVMVSGILVGLVGIAGIIAAYPVYRSVYDRNKKKYTPRILALTEELSVEKK